VCPRLSPRRIFSRKSDVEDQDIIKIRTNETVFAICATSPILKINDEAGEVTTRAVATGNVGWLAVLFIE
jgi:hypothetical protein